VVALLYIREEKMDNREDLNLPNELSALLLLELIEVHNIPYVVYSSGPYFASGDLSEAKGRHSFHFVNDFIASYQFKYDISSFEELDVRYLGKEELDEFLDMYPGDESFLGNIVLVGWRTALIYLLSSGREIRASGRKMPASSERTEAEKDDMVSEIWTNLLIARRYLNEFGLKVVDLSPKEIDIRPYSKGMEWLNTINNLIEKRYWTKDKGMQE
jgi:hypothetical protein